MSSSDWRTRLDHLRERSLDYTLSEGRLMLALQIIA
jgi:hypothetical protein